MDLIRKHWRRQSNTIWPNSTAIKITSLQVMTFLILNRMNCMKGYDDRTVCSRTLKDEKVLRGGCQSQQDKTLQLYEGQPWFSGEPMMSSFTLRLHIHLSSPEMRFLGDRLDKAIQATLIHYTWIGCSSDPKTSPCGFEHGPFPTISTTTSRRRITRYRLLCNKDKFPDWIVPYERRNTRIHCPFARAPLFSLRQRLEKWRGER